MSYTEAEIRYQEKLKERLTQLEKYWSKNPGRVTIVLSEDDRTALTIASTGKKSGHEWSKLDSKIRANHTQSVNEMLWAIMQRNPQAFLKEQYEFMQRYAKSNFKVQPLYKKSKF